MTFLERHWSKDFSLAFSGALIFLSLTGDPSLVRNDIHLNEQPPPQDVFGSQKETEGKEFDMLDYFIKRTPEPLTGTHILWQISDMSKNSSYYFKGPESFELHDWDEEFIYLKIDKSNPKRPYEFSEKAWLKRKMKVGDTIENLENTVQWFDGCTPAKQEQFPYKIKFKANYSRFNLGGDLGVQDVNVVEYSWGIENWDKKSAPSYTNHEDFYYAQSLGWVMWQWFDDKEKKLVAESIFNKIYRGKSTFLPKDTSCSSP